MTVQEEAEPLHQADAAPAKPVDRESETASAAIGTILTSIARVAILKGEVCEHLYQTIGAKRVFLSTAPALARCLYELSALHGRRYAGILQTPSQTIAAATGKVQSVPHDKLRVLPGDIVVDFQTPPAVLDGLVQQGATVLQLDRLLNEMYVYHLLVRPIQQLLEARSGVRIMILRSPQMDDIVNKTPHETSVAGPGYVSMLKQCAADGIPPADDDISGMNSMDAEQMRDLFVPFRLTSKGGIQRLVDRRGPMVNVIDGLRFTTDVPASCVNNVYVFGHSAVYGPYNQDATTLPSLLQQAINRQQIGYGVVNCANHSGTSYWHQVRLAEQLAVTSGDVLVFTVTPKNYSDVLEQYFPLVDVNLYLQHPRNPDDVFIDSTHVGPRGNAIGAEALFDALLAGGHFERSADAAIQLPAVSTTRKVAATSDSSEMRAFIQRARDLEWRNTDRVGAIVLNGNPFTLGHQYLIEYAASRVFRLYLFVVEADRSIFPFSDRIALARLGTAHLDNVAVMPSGEFIISQKTFEAYFDKENLQTSMVDPSSDVRIFGEQIAPELGITIRFVGEEPRDAVTRQYNAAMKAILPPLGVDVDVIPRRELDGAPISASRVRELLAQGDFDRIATIVPTTTLEYLRQKYSHRSDPSPVAAPVS